MRLRDIIPATLLLLSSCYQVCTTEGMTACKKGHVIMFSCCSGTTFLEMHTAEPIGKDIVVGSTTYHNAIQVVGRLEGDVNVRLRKYDEEKDKDMIDITCYCLLAEQWASLPKYVIEPGSVSDCSEAE